MLLPPPHRCGPRVTGSASRPRPQQARDAVCAADRLPAAPPDSPAAPWGPWPAVRLPPGLLTSAARGWLRRHCAPNMAAADQAAHIRSAEGGRAGERERAEKARRRLPEAPVAIAASSRRTQRAPGHPTPILTRFTPTLKEREKERYLSPSERDAEAPTIPRTGAAKRWQRRLQPKNNPTLARVVLLSPPPPRPLESRSARAGPLPNPNSASTLTLAVGSGRCSNS